MPKQNKAKDLSIFAQHVWSQSTIEGKRQAMNVLLDNCRFKANLGRFQREIDDPSVSAKRLDFIASSIMLCDTDRVIK